MCEAQDAQRTNHEVGLRDSGCVVSRCAWVVCAVPACWLAAGYSSAWCQCLVPVLGAALSSCIMHDHVNGVCLPPPHSLPPPQTGMVIPHGAIG